MYEPLTEQFNGVNQTTRHIWLVNKVKIVNTTTKKAASWEIQSTLARTRTRRQIHVLFTSIKFADSPSIWAKFGTPYQWFYKPQEFIRSNSFPFFEAEIVKSTFLTWLTKLAGSLNHHGLDFPERKIQSLSLLSSELEGHFEELGCWWNYHLHRISSDQKFIKTASNLIRRWQRLKITWSLL